jgi:RimJ/RimL family protein N-acetyltransferase
MPELGPAAWPPAPIRTERLVLRAPEAKDRTAFIELLASPEVSAYLGGPRPRDELDGDTIGQVILKRAEGISVPAAAGKAELGYLFLPPAWGFGYAAEACAAALGWLAGELPGEPVVLFTQTANARSMRLALKLGFTEAGRFNAWDAEQWFGLRPPAPPAG